MNRQKLIILLLLTGIAVLVFIMAASLNQIRLQPGQSFSIPSMPTLEALSLGVTTFGKIPVQVLLSILIITSILTPFALITMLVSKKWRKQLAVVVLLNALVILSFMGLQTIVPKGPMVVPKIDSNSKVSSAFTISQPPEWIIGVICLVLAIILALIIIGLIRNFFNRPKPIASLSQIAREAQNALDRLKLGEDVRETIIRCYLEMIQVVRNTHGTVREQYVTPREFEILLEDCGLPAKPLLRLTKLFEDARYGDQPSGPEEKQMAIICLQDIATACRAGELNEA